MASFRPSFCHFSKSSPDISFTCNRPRLTSIQKFRSRSCSQGQHPAAFSGDRVVALRRAERRPWVPVPLDPNTQNECAYSVLHTAITRRRVKNLRQAMKTFLRNCNFADLFQSAPLEKVKEVRSQSLWSRLGMTRENEQKRRDLQRKVLKIVMGDILSWLHQL